MKCHCVTCGIHNPATGMVACPECGCKRCPHATFHEEKCTRSNESGQPGSFYGPREHLNKRYSDYLDELDKLWNEGGD